MSIVLIARPSSPNLLSACVKTRGREWDGTNNDLEAKMKFGIGSISRKNHQIIVALFLIVSMGMIAVHVDAQTDGKSKTTATKKQQGKTSADGKAGADSKATTDGKTDDSTPFTSDNFIKDKPHIRR